MTNQSLEKRILEKIKKEKIKPKSKWYFIIKNSFFFSIFIISIILGSLSFSVLFYIFSNNQSLIFDYYNVYELKNAILFWLFLLIIFFGISIWNNKNLKNSYKYQPSTIILFNLSISLVLGLILFYTGIAKKTDEISAKNLDFYQKNIKITEIKKKIFLKKLKEIGITKKILEEHPELKIKIEQKFNEKVLGERILNKEQTCKKENISCKTNEIPFKKENGCGCKKIYR